MWAGRIPVTIDTAMLLPCSDVIPWHECCVWVHKSDVDNRAKYILDWHRSKIKADFESIQHLNRTYRNKYLSSPGFFHNLLEFYLPKMANHEFKLRTISLSIKKEVFLNQLKYFIIKP
jgi:hypothetical protein